MYCMNENQYHYFAQYKCYEYDVIKYWREREREREREGERVRESERESERERLQKGFEGLDLISKLLKIMNSKWERTLGIINK